MAGKLKLQLTVGFYDQPQLDKDGNFDRDKGTLTRRNRGQIFEAQSQAEYDRLLGAGAAVDPDKANEEEAARLRARLEELESEKAATAAQLAATEQATPDLDPNDLKGKELDKALADHGLSTEGNVDEKRARLAEALTPTPTWA